MALNCFSLLEVQTLHNRVIIGISFFDVRKTSRKMSRQEAEAGIMVI
jgi:hypothetical protein